MDQFYIGQTSDLNNRLIYHNSNRVKSTKLKGPWIYIFSKQLDSLNKALVLERKLKNFKSHKRLVLWIKNHLDFAHSVGPEFYQIFDLE